MKEKIPNILTIIRISLTPIIMILGLTKHFYSMTIIGIIAALTDFFDGYLARKWQVTSVRGAKLDAVADKVFAISLVGCLIGKNKILIIAFILESFHKKLKIRDSFIINNIFYKIYRFI